MNLLSQLDLSCTTLNYFGWINYLRDKTFAELATRFRLITYNLFPLIDNFRRGYFVTTEFHSAALVSGVLVLCIPTHNFMAYRAIFNVDCDASAFPTRTSLNILTQDSSDAIIQVNISSTTLNYCPTHHDAKHSLTKTITNCKICFATFSLISHRSNASTFVKRISCIQVAGISENNLMHIPDLVSLKVKQLWVFWNSVWQ